MFFQVITSVTLFVLASPNYARSLNPKAAVIYTLWINDKEKSTLNMEIPPNTLNFYTLMVLAAVEQPDVYNFTSTIHPKYGHYITGIGDTVENKEANHYWMLYILDEKPDVNNKPSDKFLSDVGVDFIKVTSGKSYLFWYKKVDL